MKILYRSSLYFSYSQFMVFDGVCGEAGLAWTQSHGDQGFIRRANSVSFATMAEDGQASLLICLGEFPNVPEYVRAIEVPIHFPSGSVVVKGPEEFRDREFPLEPGHYVLVAAQTIVAPHPPHDELYDQPVIAIDLFFNRVESPSQASRILVRDERIPATDLLEWGEAF